MKTQSIRVIGEKVIELKKNLVTIYDSTLINSLLNLG